MTLNRGIKFTVRDYMNTPDDTRYELIAGELYLTPSPTPNHQRASAEIFSALRDYVREHHLGEVFYAPLDVILSDYDVVQPDVLFISNERSSIVIDRVRGAPDLVVEILSPSTETRDRTLKRAIYADHGVRELWFVDTIARRIEVLQLQRDAFVQVGDYGEGHTLVSPLLPGLEIQVQSLFAELSQS